MTSLYDFSSDEALAVREVEPVLVNGSAIAWVGPGNRDGPIAVAHRHRYPYDGGKQDYFRKLGGYTFGSRALDQMKRLGVVRIAIQEIDNNRVLEFDLAQYLTSNLTSDTISAMESRSAADGTNVCVPAENSLYEWTAEEAVILSKSGLSS